MPDEWIRVWGDPALREVASPVLALDDLLRRQVARMQHRLSEAQGAGLAATQVGLLRRLFVFRMSAESPIEVAVNPRITAASTEEATFVEGCLSFPGIVVEVQRPTAVRVACEDVDGRSRILDVEGFGASLLQHEIDHLDGILTLDRAEPAERRRATAELLESTSDTLRAA